MTKRETILAVGLMLALPALGIVGVMACRQRQAHAELQEQTRARSVVSERQVQQLKKQLGDLEKQVTRLEGDLAAAKFRGVERENELTALHDKNGEFERQTAELRNNLAFSAQLINEARYDTAAQVLALPSCVLTDARNEICAASFKDAAGRRFSIGGPGARPEVAGFIGSLEDGKSYTLPAAFIDYQKNHPAQIPPKAEPPPEPVLPPKPAPGEQF